MPPKKKKLSREEILANKRRAEKLRYERLKNDPQKREEMREKERLKYIKKKEKGVKKLVRAMNPREHRAAKKTWREYAATHRAKKAALKEITNTFIRENTPNSDRENTPPIQVPTPMSTPRSIQSEKRKRRSKKLREKVMKDKNKKILEYKKKLEKYKKRIQRLEKTKEKTVESRPDTILLKMLDSVENRKEVIKKAVFGQILNEQLKENYAKLSSRKDKQIFSKVVSGNLTEKYKLWRTCGSAISFKQVTRSTINSTLEPKKAIRRNRISNNIITMVHNYFEDDSNSRLGAGKREYITRKGLKKQKRYLLDSILNLYKKFNDNGTISISYQTFCRLRPFWVVSPKINERDTCLCITHANLDLKLLALHKRKILPYNSHQNLLQDICCDRYNVLCLARQCQRCANKVPNYKEFNNTEPIHFKKWIPEKQTYINPKTKTSRFVTKYLKQVITVSPRQLIEEVDKDLITYLPHERNILHQYKSIKQLKESLSEKDVLIHMDFSENYTTKYGQEIQAYHFGGSRAQISLHTVIVYTKDTTQSFCTVSKNTSHSPAAIWTHLQPVIDSLSPVVTTIHFMSDGPVTQYRNKTMFYILASKLPGMVPNMHNFSYNFSEAGHGKGAPDGLGATCKRTADAVVAAGGDIDSLETFVEAIQNRCSGIQVLIIDSKDIEEMTKLIENETKGLKSFVGTLKVHQITAKSNTIASRHPLKLTMKSLSCFCNDDCTHYKIGTLDFNFKQKLQVDDVYTDSESNDRDVYENKSDTVIENVPGPSSGPDLYNIGDFVLVKFKVYNIEYRYAGVISQVDLDEGEITVTFLKISDKKAHLFRLDENDVSDVNVDQIIEKLSNPDLKMKGNRLFYYFKTPVPVFEK